MAPWRDDFENTDAALILVVVVVAVASAGSRAAGYVAALSSAVWFDFFLTRPYGQFSIDRASDVETTVLLLGIGVAVTEIAVWGRRQQASASQRAGYLTGIHAAAEAAVAADGGFGVVGHVSEQLIELLTLSSCQFQHGVAGLGVIGRLHHDGSVTVGARPWPSDEVGLPTGGDVELLVQGGGYLQGRFVLTAMDGSRPTLEQRLVATALADQVGAALARGTNLRR